MKIIEDILGKETVLAEGWRMAVPAQASDLWLSLYKEPVDIPEQGWKLHVSANPQTAAEVLKRTLPILLAETSTFKVISSISRLVEFNFGLLGLSQIGKFITAYPRDDAHAVSLAVALDEATRGLCGPAVPSDHPLGQDSVIYYRYGTFSKLNVESQSAEAQPAIRTPKGETIPDLRLFKYAPPEWVIDPFVGAGVSTAIVEPSPLVGGRYLITTALNASARGEVYLAIDLVEQRTCVLKRAPRNAAVGLDGTGAGDRLRNEAAILALLAPDPRFPAVYDLFEQDGDLYLVMEEVDGQTLSSTVRELALQGRHPSAPQILTWARELASILATIHAKGFVYRDLKASNIMVSAEGRLVLLDFDICQEIGAPVALYSPGTVGYISRQQQANEPPNISHDVYSFGALLYFIVSGAEPFMYSRPYNLLDRPLDLMNPTISPQLAEVIARCLNPDPEERFASMQALEDALASIGESEAPIPSSVVRRPSSEGDHYRDLACQLADALCEAAQWRDRRTPTWATQYPPDNHISSRSISTGGAGILLALAELAAEFGDKHYFDALKEGATWLANAPPLPGEPLAGLYTGEAGVAVAVLRVGQVLHNQDFLDHSSQLLGYVAQRGYGPPHNIPSLFNGIAGRLRAHLLVWDATRAPEQLAAAVAAGDTLLQSAERTRKGLLWPIPEGFGYHSGRAYTGYAAGAAGIGDALLDLFEASGEDRSLKAARAAARWLKSVAMPSLDDESGLDWPAIEGESLQGAHWASGAAGIGRFFLHAAQLDVVPGAEDVAHRAARTTALGARWSGPSQVSGLCGNIEFLLDMHKAYPSRNYLDDAMTLARILEAHSVKRGGFTLWPTESPMVFTPGFAVGNAGVAMRLLRLGDPEGFSSLLSRQSFRRLPANKIQ